LEADYLDFIHTQEALDPDAIKEKTADTIDAKFKDFFLNVQKHRKGLLSSGQQQPGGPVDMKALSAFSAKIGGNNTI